MNRADKDRFEQDAAALLDMDYKIRQFNNRNELVAGGDSEWYFPVLYTAPQAKHDARGLDHGSDPLRFSTLKAAAKSGKISTSKTIQLVRNHSGEQGVLMVIPVRYASTGLAENRQERQRGQQDFMNQQDLRGYLIAVIRIDELFADAARENPKFQSILHIKNTDAQSTNDLIQAVCVTRGKTAAATQTDLNLRQLQPMAVLWPGNECWFVDCYPTVDLRSFVSWQMWCLQAGALLLTGMINVFLLVITGYSAGVENLVRQRTEQLQVTNADLLLARHQAESAARIKTEFLTNMSHEMRTPLTAMLGFGELLEEELQEKQTREFLQTIQQNGRFLLSIINDILDFSKIDAGKLTVERTPVELEALLLELQRTFVPQAERKGITLRFTAENELPRRILTDSLRLNQILINLIGNAIKFTTEGEVEVRIQRKRINKLPLLDIAVRDTGIGMTAEQQRGLFQPFVQADNSTSRRFGGTGLGLTISQRLAVLMQGRIEVTSEPGRGSVFTLRLAQAEPADVELCRYKQLAGQELHEPVADPNDEQSGKLVDAELAVTPALCMLSQRSVLLVEDGPDNRRLFTRILQSLPLSVKVVENGQEAVDLILGEPHLPCAFDLILMDMQMPILDGYQATRQLRAAGYTGKIIALTAHAMQSDRELCLSAGCDDYLTKPIIKAEFLAKIRSYLYDAPVVDTAGA